MSPSWRSTSTPASHKVRRFYALDDCGTRINPMIIEGTVHGGCTEGVRDRDGTGERLRRRRQRQGRVADGLLSADRGRDAALGDRLHRDALAASSIGAKGDDLAGIKAPAGLDIAAITSEEIALSIIAEMTAVRRRPERPEASVSSAAEPHHDRPRPVGRGESACNPGRRCKATRRRVRRSAYVWCRDKASVPMR